jgi:predicted permease
MSNATSVSSSSSVPIAPPAGLDVTEVVVAVILSVAIIIVYAVVGALMARFHLLDAKTHAILGRCVFLLFLPAILFLEVSSQSKSGLHLILATLVTIGVGAIVGVLVSLRASASMKRCVIASVTIPNMASIPLALASRLFVSGDAPLLRDLEGASAALSNIAITLVVLEALVWGAGYSFLREQNAAAVDHAALPEATADGNSGGVDGVDGVDGGGDDADGVEMAPALEDWRVVPERRSDAVVDDSSAEADRSWKARIREGWLRYKGPVLRVINPPFVAVVLGLLVGNTDMRLWFHKDSGSDSPPLSFFVTVLRSAANCVVPCLLLIVGLSFAHVQTFLPKRGDALDWTTLVLVCVCRLVVVPAIMLGLMEASKDFFNPTERIIVLMQACTPINIDVLIIAHLNEHNVNETTVLMFWTYALSVATMVGWLVLFVLLHAS